MFRKMLLSVLGFLVLSVCVISGVDAGTYDGEWEGKTDQGYNVSFTINNDIITYFIIKYEFKGSYCSGSTWSSMSGKDSISGNTFTASNSPTDITGTFTNSDTCKGTWKGGSSYCNATASGTWEATKIISQACIRVAKDLIVNIPCAEYNAHKYAFALKPYANTDDPMGLYWMMDMSTFKELEGYSGSCLNVKSDLALNMCAQYGGTLYEFTLDFYQTPQHSDVLYWNMNLSTFKAH